VPVYYVIQFFFHGIKKGSLNTRASAIAFNFLLAMAPGTIFLLTILPYVPINNFQDNFLVLLKEIMPLDAYQIIEITVNELFVKRGRLQFFGFVTAVFFSIKGVSSIINAFNATFHDVKSRPFIQVKLISLGLVLIFSFLLFTSMFFLLFSRLTIDLMVSYGVIQKKFTLALLTSGKWLIIGLLVFSAISFLYYLAPRRNLQWKFISPGSTLATILTIISTILFSYFMNNFAELNRIFGSIGALIVLMLWLNFIALALLIGFELNASIKNARENNFEPITSLDVDE
ncbi:MAG: YihY/virulence factor BrkB family protein, partial [Bacteroidota bacterium]